MSELVIDGATALAVAAGDTGTVAARPAPERSAGWWRAWRADRQRRRLHHLLFGRQRLQRLPGPGGQDPELGPAASHQGWLLLVKWVSVSMSSAL